MEGYLIVSDESVNQYGFRVLSSGGDFTRFNKNPIMLYVHERSANGKAKLPIGKWEGLQVTADGRIMAKPIFNEKNPDGASAKQSFEDGFLNAASIHIDPIEWSEDPALMLPGQVLPTVTKWSLLEISMADIPVNGNAVRMSHHGKTIKLSDDADHSEELNKLFYPTTKNGSMKSIIAVLNALNIGLSLSDDAKEADVISAIQKALGTNKDAISAKDQLITQLTSERDALKLAKEQAEQQAKDDKATALVDGAIQAKKITAGQKEHYVKLAKADYDTTKAVLDGMQGYQSVHKQLNLNGGEGGEEDLAKRYDELFKSNKLASLKTTNWDEYAKLHKAKYGTDAKK